MGRKAGRLHYRSLVGEVAPHPLFVAFVRASLVHARAEGWLEAPKELVRTRPHPPRLGPRAGGRVSTPTDPRLHRLKRALPQFEQKMRVRVGGLVFDDAEAPSAVVLVEHEGLWSSDPFWTPPGGEVEYGESLPEALVREVKEETGLEVKVGPLRYTLDFVRLSLAVSFYFACRVPGGLPERFTPGTDPEHGAVSLIRGVRVVPFEELAGLNIYSEGFAERLPEAARAGFPDGVAYLGTLR